MKYISFLIFIISIQLGFSQTFVKDSLNNQPVSFATIDFGNGYGTFADEEGKFYYSEKLYKGIDTLAISALGYKKKKVATNQLGNSVLLNQESSMLEEVIVTATPKGKYKLVTLKPNGHEDYFKCWLPTIESEIAVFFPNNSPNTKRISKLLLPIKTEAKNWDKRHKDKHEKRPFSTLFRVQFYDNNNGLPGDVLTYEKILFIANQDTDPIFEFDVTNSNIIIPEDGIFVSIQVLGYTDKDGKLLPNKKYKEVETKRGTVKVSTTFRPLLPFTDQIASKHTYVKRIFHNNGEWVLFDQKNIKNSNLLKAGLNNYGMGLKVEVYKDK
ncbi:MULTISPECIES: carboxypeptidase-like regulatory domain-containing protein [Mesoflavibacter]|uniref:Carboxypeptidase-like regulatory domain-containing protein n=1 Tax=Mesoflavibacter profundi TaxID=2708110 RepID=A0ABT4RW39_9FLAO|nr:MULTISPECIES: carboxypeptidase-like regulatory domain-containing protein [Mesoflavibacter]MDA0176051.1 carboxypeptidase-like regulatory domain-containing protein [Mesoflavibacter profundi]QIJ89682.1 hypothetical protein C7H62_1873 [Mesoflavibacter sp. HG96]QIJ92410.1 hypothetical protein C7H56_1873 [Mesoflavibacter sp. HG37]